MKPRRGSRAGCTTLWRCAWAPRARSCVADPRRGPVSVLFKCVNDPGPAARVQQPPRRAPDGPGDDGVQVRGCAAEVIQCGGAAPGRSACPSRGRARRSARGARQVRRLRRVTRPAEAAGCGRSPPVRASTSTRARGRGGGGRPRLCGRRRRRARRRFERADRPSALEDTTFEGQLGLGRAGSRAQRCATRRRRSRSG